MTSEEPPILEQGVLSMPDEAWERLRRQAEVIGPLVARTAVTHDAADAAGEPLGLSRRQLYVLIDRYRQGNGLLTDLAPGRSTGGRGVGRLPESAAAPGRAERMMRLGINRA